MAAIAILVHHLMLVYPDNDFIIRVSFFFPRLFGFTSSIFFILAGYFACRNITWKKALNNAWWSLAPMLLWSLLLIPLLHYSGKLPPISSWGSLLGIHSFIYRGWVLLPEGSTLPVNGPLWFMRDLIFLFLFSPIIAKCARYLFLALLVLSFVPSFQEMFTHGYTGVTMSPYSLAYFTTGCFLRTLSRERQQKVLTFYSTTIIAVSCILQYIYCKVLLLGLPLYFIHTLFLMWIFYQISRWIEVRLPFLNTYALKFAPVTFLTFAGHMLIYTAFPTTCIPLLLTYPLLVFVCMSLLFFGLKRWGRPLLHLVAHYKLRPDDLLPAAKVAPEHQADSRSKA